MKYVGLDAHLRRSTFCVLDEHGKKLLYRDVQGTWEKVIEELMDVKEQYPGPMWVCYEASCGYGHLHDELSKFAERVVVAHPGHLRLIFKSKKKNDRVDARKLATLLFLDQVPTVYVPQADIRSWRQTIEYRDRLVRKQTTAKNQIRAHLRSLGIVCPRGLWQKKGREWLSGLEMPDDLSALRLSMLIDELDGHRQNIQLVEKILNRKGRRHPGVQVLRSIPGIGARTAECLIAYIDDASRFGGSGRVASYFGLVPCQDASAGKNRLGHITKQGPSTARRLLVEASWVSVRKSPKVRAYFERIMRGDPDRKKIAIVATAHYLLRVSLRLLKTGELWEEA